MVEIRAAVEQDIPAMLGLAKRMHGESPRFSRLTFSPAKCEALMRGLLAGKVAGGVLVAEKAGIIVGMAAVYVVEHFMAIEKVASDLAVYVTPECRGGSIAPKLIKAVERMAREAGAVEVTLGISTEVAADRTLALYQDLGYRLSGYLTFKELF